MIRSPLKWLALLAAFAAAAPVTSGSAQSGETIRIIAIDANISGNTATSLGPLNGCVRAEPGQTVVVDLVVDAVPEERGMIGFEMDIEYTAANLEVVASDSEFLLAADPPFEPFQGLGDPVPDSDGLYHMSILDLRSNDTPGSNIESGPGVLTRITLTAKAAGVAAIGPVFNPPDQYPTVLDRNNVMIGVDTIGRATIAVGQDCTAPPEATPEVTELPPIEEIYPDIAESPGAETPGPTGPDGNGETTGPTDGPTDGPTATRASRTPTPSATNGEPGVTDIDEEGDGGTSTGAVIAAAILAIGGVGLAAGGGWMLYKRRLGSA